MKELKDKQLEELQVTGIDFGKPEDQPDVVMVFITYNCVVSNEERALVIEYGDGATVTPTGESEVLLFKIPDDSDLELEGITPGPEEETQPLAIAHYFDELVVKAAGNISRLAQ